MKKILSEIITVILGILIALFINNWKEEASNKKYIQDTLTSIHKEMEESHAEVEKVLQTHYTLADSLTNNLTNNRSTREIIGQVGGMKFPFIKNIGLRFFIAGKAELIEYEVISSLTEIEQGTNLLEKKLDKLMDYTYENMENTDEKSKMMFLIHLSNVMDSESQLLEQYDSFLEREGDGNKAEKLE